MAESFIDKVNESYKKGITSNPQFQNAIHVIEIVAKGNEEIGMYDSNNKKIKEEEPLEL